MGEAPTIEGSLVNQRDAAACKHARGASPALARFEWGREPVPSAACALRLGPGPRRARPPLLNAQNGVDGCELRAEHTRTRAGESALGATLSAGRQCAMGGIRGTRSLGNGLWVGNPTGALHG